MLSSYKTKFNLTSTKLHFRNLSEWVSVLSQCWGFPELEDVDFYYSKADVQDEDHAVLNANKEFKENTEFFSTLYITKEDNSEESEGESEGDYEGESEEDCEGESEEDLKQGKHLDFNEETC